MATIPTGQQFHTLSADVDTVNRGSATANSDRTIFTMADIQATIDSGVGHIGGSIADNQVAVGATTANNIEGSSSLTFDGTDMVMPRYIVHEGDVNTHFGFNSNENFQVQTNGNVQIQSNENHVNLNHAGAEKIRTKAVGVTVTGQMDLAALNIAPASATDTGTVGEIRWTSPYLYLCTATDTWLRVLLETWA